MADLDAWLAEYNKRPTNRGKCYQCRRRRNFLAGLPLHQQYVLKKAPAVANAAKEVDVEMVSAQIERLAEKPLSEQFQTTARTLTSGQ